MGRKTDISCFLLALFEKPWYNGILEKRRIGMKKEEKTNAVRQFEQKKLAFSLHCYGGTEAISGTEVARVLGQNPADVYKTLVTSGKSGAHYVFVVPVEKELDLKKAAAAVGEKNVAMLPAKELLPLTGYVHGGCSPVGMKKLFRTTLDESAKQRAHIFFSGGRIGLQIETAPAALAQLIPFTYAALCRDTEEENHGAI
jgi:Cys-tRNA(Pro)/Cys-tRNA(Cys) deacylase